MLATSLDYRDDDHFGTRTSSSDFNTTWKPTGPSELVKNGPRRNGPAARDCAAHQHLEVCIQLRQLA